MSKMYSCRPSSLLDVQDAYTAFCFDEACAYILTKVTDGEQPDFSVFKTETSSYARPSDFYKKIQGRG